MLLRLRIHEYALIDEVQVELGPGLNVLTGETGAGKSIIVDSLTLLLGRRASSEAIREGAERAVVEGLFQVDGQESLVRREIHRDRSNRCFLDGGMATARMIQERTERWVDLHGQHEDQLLLKRAVQRELLDAFAGSTGIAVEVADLADRLAATVREAEELERADAERAARIDYLRSQVAELAAAALRPGEEEELESEARLLAHGEERMQIAGAAYDALEGGDEALVSALAALQRRLDRLAELDAALSESAERLRGARHEIGDLARELAGYAEAVDHDPARLAATEERRDLLFRLKRKHAAGSLEELAEKEEAMAAELESLERAAVRGTELEAERRAVGAALAEAAGRLADAREAGADRLEAAVRDRLTALGMGDGRLVVQLDRRADGEGVEWAGERYAWTRGGIEEVSFLIAPNPGEPARALSLVASGGELSRVLLAIKSTLAAVDRVPTLVFDEIDAGIGGVVAQHVARQLQAVAEHHQVVVVTHLAQIAAVADRHLLVEKAPAAGRTVTTVRVVTGDERIREVSRLLGGDPDRDVSRHHAEALLAGGT